MITLCIADDNREIVDLLTRQLETETDLKVVGTAFDGEACLDVVKTHQPDVLLLDIIMPHLDGIGVLERLQDEMDKGKPEVIMLSAFGKDEVTKQAVQLGASYFLVKPFNIQQLIAKIRELAAGSNREFEAMSPEELDISLLLQQLGISPRIKGFKYIRQAVIYVRERQELLGLITKELYPMIAKEHETTSSRVERAMRHAIKTAWENGMRDHEMFNGRPERERSPKNSEFISYFVTYQSFKHQ
ncbi:MULTISPECIES: sporulation transcription factor Spo0A [Exiguobacterium]|uniref:Stage 0 sporulation protein A homolog n=1 Tax=Exiguobacterium aurantiacum TaxID=33987 RepID=A0A377FTK8_9BACL|nr:MULTISPECIES: sporulation transcription factor Spo0A [Exiguobacterium]STO07894.1 Stage 0 sporulation protein G [Exiguobacterium aurantiacum]